MAKDIRYWDSNAFLGYLAEEPGKVELCEPVLAAASEGKVLIVTSALTIAEVLWVKGQNRLERSKREKVEKFFRSDFIEVVNVTRKVADFARDVVWDFNIKPKDAVHVATAIFHKLSVLETFDDPLIGKTASLSSHGIIIRNPHIVRQEDLLEGLRDAKESG